MNRAEELELVGGALCLDFTNTVGNQRSGEPNERLSNYADLFDWSVRAGALTKKGAAELKRLAEMDPGRAEQAFHRARTLRQALFRIFSSIVAGHAAPSGDLELLNEYLSKAMAATRIVARAEGRLAFEWSMPKPDLAQMLLPIARSAGAFLTSDQLHNLHECAGENCTWLFVDASKNHSRRWCSMSDCGNRAKARRHYAREARKRKTPSPRRMHQGRKPVFQL